MIRPSVLALAALIASSTPVDRVGYAITIYRR